MNGMWELEWILKMQCRTAYPRIQSKRGDEGLSAQKRKGVVAGCGKQYPAQRAQRSIRAEVEGPARREERVFRLLAP